MIDAFVVYPLVLVLPHDELLVGYSISMSHLKIKSSMTTMTQEVYEYNIFGFKMKILKAAVVLAMHFTGLRLDKS